MYNNIALLPGPWNETGAMSCSQDQCRAGNEAEAMSNSQDPVLIWGGGGGAGNETMSSPRASAVGLRTSLHMYMHVYVHVSLSSDAF